MSNPRATARIAGRPLHAMLAPYPLACFVLTLVFDLAYWKTAAMQWANMSAWLLLIGLVLAAVAVLLGLVDYLGEGRIRSMPSVYLHALANGVALVLEIINCGIHTRDAYTSVVPTGLLLSAVSVAILLVSAWIGAGMVHLRGVGVEPEDFR